MQTNIAKLNTDRTVVQEVYATANGEVLTVNNAAGANATQVQGAAASGVAKAGNPVQIGGVYNTTQPTVTNGQAVELQASSRGAILVTTGTENVVATTIGNVASGVADSGAPVKVGGKYNVTLPTYADGQRADLAVDARGNVRSVQVLATNTGADGMANTSLGAAYGTTGTSQLLSIAGQYSLNGAGTPTWDRNRSSIVTPSATLTGYQNVLPTAVYNASPTTRTEGQGGPFQCDTAGNVKVTFADTTLASYSASVTALAPAATATDIFEIAGSGTKTIKIRRIQISGAATAAGAYDFVFAKRSTANTAGTSTTPTVVPHDSANAAGTAVVKAYTANPTIGSLVGNVRAVKGTVTTAAGAIPNVPVVLDWNADRDSQPIVLRGTAQSLCINLAGATMTGGTLDIDIEWTEE